MRRSTFCTAAVLLGIAVALTSCGDAQRAGNSAKKQPDSALYPLTLDWTGGFAGRQDKLIVTSDGATELVSGSPGSAKERCSTLSVLQRETLRSQLNAAYPALDENYLEQPVPDGFAFTLTTPKTKTTFGDGGKTYPPELGELAATLKTAVVRMSRNKDLSDCS